MCIYAWSVHIHWHAYACTHTHTHTCMHTHAYTHEHTTHTYTHTCTYTHLYQVIWTSSNLYTHMHVHNAVHIPFLAQWGFTALLRAAYHGQAEVVRMLKDEFSCSLEEVENVSMYHSMRDDCMHIARTNIWSVTKPEYGINITVEVFAWFTLADNDTQDCMHWLH